MSNLITFEASRFLALVDNMLRDENGISHYTYSKLYHLCVYQGHIELWQKISKHVEATDDRFYIAKDAPHLANLLLS